MVVTCPLVRPNSANSDKRNRQISKTADTGTPVIPIRDMFRRQRATTPFCDPCPDHFATRRGARQPGGWFATAASSGGAHLSCAGSGARIALHQELASDACATPHAAQDPAPAPWSGSPAIRAQPASACGASAASLPSSAAISAQTSCSRAGSALCRRFIASTGPAARRRSRHAPPGSRRR